MGARSSQEEFKTSRFFPRILTHSSEKHSFKQTQITSKHNSKPDPYQEKEEN